MVQLTTRIFITTENYASCLMPLTVGFPSQKPEFNVRIYVGFVMEKRPLGQLLLRVIRFAVVNTRCTIACVIEEMKDVCSITSSFSSA